MRLVKGLTVMLLLAGWLGSCMHEQFAEPASVLEDVYPNPNADSVLKDVYGPSELLPPIGSDGLFENGHLMEEEN